jgi:hypothetical protein
VPAPPRPTDWERDVAGLASADYITADMAFRRTALHAAHGFDERFPAAFREDAELACRLLSAGWLIVRGSRAVVHPVPAAGRFVSVRRQRGNADDALMRALHGRRWRELAHVPRGRRPRHLATTAAALTGIASMLFRRRPLAALSLAAWAAGTLELTVARVRAGPGTIDEITTMAVTSALLPPAATMHWLRGVLRWRVLARPRPLATSPPDHAPGGGAGRSHRVQGEDPVRPVPHVDVQPFGGRLRPPDASSWDAILARPRAGPATGSF